MDYEKLWNEMKDYLRSVELVYNELGTERLKIKAEAASMFQVCMKILEQQENPKVKTIVTYDFGLGQLVRE